MMKRMCCLWVVAAMGLAVGAGVESFGDWTFSDAGGLVQVSYRGTPLVTRIGATLFKNDYSKMLFSTQGVKLRREGDSVVFRVERPEGTATFAAKPSGKRVEFRLDCDFKSGTGAFEYGFFFPVKSYVFNANPPFLRCGGRMVDLQQNVKASSVTDASLIFETPTRHTVFSNCVKSHAFTFQDVREKDGSGCVRYISCERYEGSWQAHFAHELVVEDDYDETVVAARRRAFSQLLERREAMPLVNAGFENGKADGWHFHSNMSIDEQVAHSGKKSAKVVYGPKSGGHVYLTREIPVQGGARYDASVWVKTENVTEAETKPPCCGAGIIVEWLDKNGKWLTSGEYDCNVFGTHDWQLKRCANLVAPEDAGFAEIYLTLRAHGTVWFDDLSFNRVYVTTDKIAPALGSTLADNTPFFTWRHGRCIRRYLLELSRDANFPANATRVYKVGGLSEYQLTEPLEPGQWFWRVSGAGMEDAGPWSFIQTASVDHDCLPPQVRARAARVTSSDGEFRVSVEENAPGADPVVTFRGPAFTVTGTKVRDLGKGEREYAFSAPVGGWPKGVSEGTLVAVDAAGNRSERTFWLCNAPKPANHTFVRSDGYWECGGSRFTPLGIYEVTKKDMREVRAAGFDVVHTYRWESDQNDVACREYLDDCWAADGLRAFVGFDRRSIVKGEYGHVARRVARLADHPGLFCWYLFDEPEIANQFVSPDQLTAYADLIRELDPYHTVVMTTWNKTMCEYRRTWDTHWSQAYGNPAEVVKLVEMQRRDIATYSPITLLVNCNDGKQGAARRRGIVPDPAKFARDYDHLRACAFLALPLECNGVFWWWFARYDRSFYSASQVPKAWADLTSIVKELGELRSVIDADGPCRVGTAKDGDKCVRWWTKTVDGQTTFVAVNTADAPANVKIEVPGEPARELSFRRYEVKVLRTLYVAPNGNDSNPGTVERPLATAAGAREAVRRMRAAGLPATAEVEVVFADGVYAFEQPLDLDARDAHVTWRAARKGGAVWSGARSVDAWRPVAEPAVRELLPAAARDQVRVGVLPGTDPLPGFRGGGCGTPGHLQEIPISIFQGTNRLELARWPNPGEGDGYARTGQPEGPFEKRHDALYSTGGTFAFSSSRLPAWAREPELWAYGLWCYEWADAKTRVEAVDCAKQTLRIDMAPLGFGLRKGVPFQIVNALSELDRPGEWVVDRARRRFYVWPLPGGESPHLAVAQGLVRAKSIDGSRFEGLVFEEVRGTAIVIENSKNAQLRGCAVRRTSSWGVQISGGSDCRVEGCDLYDLGEGGISLWGGDTSTLTPARHVVDNNHIHHYGNVIPNYRPGVSLNGVGNVCTHNLIHHTRHQAIGFGGNDHRIAFNVAHDTCTYNDDAGTIYCCTRDWTQRGTVIEHNLLHMAGKQPKCTHTDAIYLDDYSSGMIVRNNLINRATLGVHLGGGQDCVISGNVMVNCAYGVMLGSRGIDSFAKGISQKGRASSMFQTLERNKARYESPLWRARYPNLLRVYDFEDAQFAHNALFNVVTNNVLAGCGGIGRGNWKNIAPYSTVTNNLEVGGDPGFEDYAHFGWELKAGPAKALVGKLRVAEMGLYPSPTRFSPAVKFGDVTPPRPIHVEYDVAHVRIDVVHPGKLPAGEKAWADAGTACEVPEWGRGIYVMAAFGKAQDTWQTYSCSFTPRFDCTVNLITMGARGEKTLYDDFRVEGAELKNPGFEKAEGWGVPVANPNDYRAPVCNIEPPYGLLTAAQAGCAPAEGSVMACGNDMLNFGQSIQMRKGVPVRISFKARALPLDLPK